MQQDFHVLIFLATSLRVGDGGLTVSRHRGSNFEANFDHRDGGFTVPSRYGNGTVHRGALGYFL